jgi:hypothetical protein
LTVRTLGGDAPCGELNVVFIRPDPVLADCLINDLVGPDVRVDVPGTIHFKGQNER